MKQFLPASTESIYEQAGFPWGVEDALALARREAIRERTCEATEMADPRSRREAVRRMLIEMEADARMIEEILGRRYLADIRLFFAHAHIITMGDQAISGHFSIHTVHNRAKAAMLADVEAIERRMSI